MAPRRLLALLALAVGLSACPDSADRAAKKRIFSAEDPPKARLAAAEPIDVALAAQDGAVTYRILAMSAAEAFERIGPFRYSATASFEWSWGKESVSLSEKRTLEQASVVEYAVHTENSRDYGVDVLRLPDRTFARAKHHKFRERRRDRGQSDLVREDAFGALHSAQTLMGNRLGLVRDRQEEVNGRQAKRFQLMVAEKPLRALGPDFWKLPPIKFPGGGPDATTRRRAEFANLRTPRSVEGSVWVDLETGVPLRAELTATIEAPGEDKDVATLVLKVQSDLVPGGEKIVLEAPADFLPDQDRPAGIAAALDRFEVRKLDGGTAAPPTNDQDEPADEP